MNGEAKRESSELYAMAEQVRARAESILAKALERESQWLRELAGDELQCIERDLESVLSYLNDSRPAMRRAAVYVAARDFKGSPTISDRLVTMAKTDSEWEVRFEAIRALMAFRESGQAIPLRAVARCVVLDEAEQTSVRSEAYKLFCMLNGMPVLTAVRLRFPEDVSWSHLEENQE
jgi:hypothetical protein